jgi:hypothetical protein
MKPIHRQINQQRMNESMKTVTSNVMELVNQDSQKKSSWTSKRKPLVLAGVFAFVLLLVLSLNLGQDGPYPPTPELNQLEASTVAEVSYISGYLLQSSISVDNQTIFLSNRQLSAFNYLNRLSQEDTFTSTDTDYFDILTTLYRNDGFSEDVRVVNLEEGDYSYQLILQMNQEEYVMYLNKENEDISGIIQVGTIELELQGTMEETDESISIDFEATNGDDFIEIKYEYQTKNDGEKKIEITQDLNGQESKKEIKVQYGTELKVEMVEDQDSYELKREWINDEWIYKLEVKQANLELELYVIEIQDDEGNVLYQYLTEEEYDQIK